MGLWVGRIGLFGSPSLSTGIRGRPCSSMGMKAVPSLSMGRIGLPSSSRGTTGRPLGGDSIEKFQLEFWLEKSVLV